MTTTSSSIRERYGELIRLLSLIGNNTKIDGETSNSLIIHTHNDNKELLIFKLTLSSNSLDVLWKISDSIDYIGSFCFPSFLSSDTIFKDLTSRISEWHHQVTNSEISTSLQKAIDSDKDIKEAFVKDWTLIDFRIKFGPKMQIGISTNDTTKEKFPNCRFLDKNGNISAFMGFYPKLGPLTAEEIKIRRYNLFVGQNTKGKYYLHDKNVIKYEEVDLGLTQERIEEDSKEDPPNLSFTNGHFGVDYLSLDQKYALLSKAVQFGASTPYLQSKVKEVNEILDKFMDILRLNYLDINSPRFNQFKYNKEGCDETIKTIEMDGPFILFIVYCMQLIELDKSENIITEFFNTLLDIGYTNDEARIILNFDFVFRFNQE